MKCRRKAPLYEAYRFEPSNGVLFPQWFVDAIDKGDITLIACSCKTCRESGSYDILSCNVLTPFENERKCNIGDYVLLENNGGLRVYTPEEFTERMEIVP